MIAAHLVWAGTIAAFVQTLGREGAAARPHAVDLSSARRPRIELERTATVVGPRVLV
jgi:hypothetical protein